MLSDSVTTDPAIKTIKVPQCGDENWRSVLSVTMVTSQQHDQDQDQDQDHDHGQDQDHDDVFYLFFYRGFTSRPRSIILKLRLTTKSRRLLSYIS